MVCILDTSTIIHSSNLIRVLNCELKTTDKIMEEVLDYYSKIQLESLDIPVVDISKKEIDDIKIKISKYVPPEMLSDADVSLIALALKEENPLVLTDDTKLQNILYFFNIPFRSLRGIEIKHLKIYKKYCVYCKRWYENTYKICPICGKSLKIKVYKVLRRE